MLDRAVTALNLAWIILISAVWWWQYRIERQLTRDARHDRDQASQVMQTTFDRTHAGRCPLCDQPLPGDAHAA